MAIITAGHKDVVQRWFKDREKTFVKGTQLNGSAWMIIDSAFPNDIIVTVVDWFWDPVKRQHNFITTDIWHIGAKRMFKITKEIFDHSRPNVTSAMGLFVSGKFKKNRGKLIYEMPDGTMYDIPLDVEIEFVGDVPIGVPYHVVKNKRGQGRARNSQW